MQEQIERIRNIAAPLLLLQAHKIRFHLVSTGLF